MSPQVYFWWEVDILINLIIHYTDINIPYMLHRLNNPIRNHLRTIISPQELHQFKPIISHNPYFSFSLQKQVTIRVPLYNKSPVLCVHSAFQRGKALQIPSYFKTLFPAFILPFIFSYYDVWGTLWAIPVQMNAIAIGIAIPWILDRLLNCVPMVIETNDTCSELYITVCRSMYIQSVVFQKLLKSTDLKNKRRLLIPEDFINLQGIYIPIKTNKTYEDLTQRQRIAHMKYMMKIENRMVRFEVPISKIQRVAVASPQGIENEQQIEEDKEKLTFEEFWNKYKKSSLWILVDVSDKSKDDRKKVPFLIEPQSFSIDTKFIFAMAYGASIQPEFYEVPLPETHPKKKAK